VAAKPTRSRELPAARRRRHIIAPDTYERICGAPHILSPGICSCFVVSEPNTRHSTYSLRHSTIAYRWHPLSGRTLQVSPHRRGKELTCIYTTERPGFSRELPNWMFDQAYCAGMTLGAPQISLEGPTELAAVLALLGENQSPATRSPLSTAKEGTRAKKSSHNRAQFALELECPMRPLPVITGNPEGLLGALADLLLAALGFEAMMTKGDGYERQDHA
jgi:hypothetical protein